MNAATRITVTLDRERQIEFTNMARYRMATLERPFALDELADRRKTYGALVAWLWACLVPADAADFAAPEELLRHVPVNRLPELIKALGEAVKAANDSEKNAGGSTPKPSRSSSSTSHRSNSGT